jgi:hypothetical protein
MLRTVEPHDLVGACVRVGKTLADLSEHTGIPERVLLLFSLGQHALSARDRFAILEQLVEWSPDERRRFLRIGTMDALRVLMREVYQQDREENPE